MEGFGGCWFVLTASRQRAANYRERAERLGTPDRPLASLAVGGGHIVHAVFQHAGGEIGLVCDAGVRPLVELQRIED